MADVRHMTRRELIVSGAAVAAGASLLSLDSTVSPAGAASTSSDPWHGLKVGVATYTLRSMPTDAAIKAIQRVGLKYCSLKDFHLPMKSTAEERKAVAQKFSDAGITILSCGVIYTGKDEASIRAAFDYAKDTGLRTIIGSPDPDSFELLDKMVKEYDIKLAIHNHGPGDNRFPMPEDAYKAVEKYDKRLGLCIDVGHTTRGGGDAAADIVKFRDRLHDVHMKDVSAATAKGGTVESGRGVINTRAVLAALLKVKFEGSVAFEFEKDEKDPMPGLSETIGYCKGVLTGL